MDKINIFFVFVLLTVNFSFSGEIKIYEKVSERGSLNYLIINNLDPLKKYILTVETDKGKIEIPVFEKLVFFPVPYNSKNAVIVNLVEDGKVIFSEIIKVKDRKFPISKIYVKERKKTEEVLERIKKEYYLLRSLFKKVTEKKFTEKEFISPVDKLEISTPYGALRIINEKKRSVHWGVDFKAPTGTPVKASLSGKVVLADNLFYTGETVIIDHGLGLYTLYAHLSEIFVKEGDYIKGGEIIGLVGSTGRSTGPHLHFGMYILGHRVDPELAIDNIFIEY